MDRTEKMIWAVKIHAEAIVAADKAAHECIPTPMVVEGYSRPIMDGACGYASIRVVMQDKATRTFINGLKDAGLCGGVNDFKTWSKCSGQPGFVRGYRFGGSQSYERARAGANEFVRTLRANGITAYSTARLD